jgi:transposase-like protein
MEPMPVYGPQFKEQIVKKMMPPHNQSVAQISRDTGVAVATLYSWKKLFRNQGFVVPAKSSRPDDWDSKAKLAAIIQTAAFNEAQRSEYCRTACTPNNWTPGKPLLSRLSRTQSLPAKPTWPSNARSSSN